MRIHTKVVFGVLVGLTIIGACGKDKTNIPATSGAFCAPVGAVGVTNSGMPVTCGTTNSEDRATWRAE